MSGTASAGDFPAWDFIVALHGRPVVREACLALQDRRGADVIVLLALVHDASCGAAPPGEDRLRRALARIAPWRDAAVLPLRALRRSLKDWRFAPVPADDEPAGDGASAGEAEAARQAVGAAERAAERAALSAFVRAMEGAASGTGEDDRLAVASRSIATYWRIAGFAQDGADRDSLATILAQAFPEHAGRAASAVERDFSA